MIVHSDLIPWELVVVQCDMPVLVARQKTNILFFKVFSWLDHGHEAIRCLLDVNTKLRHLKERLRDD
jgi:hypothetical protein